MSFGAGPTIKPTRPPTREYSKIERRFYRSRREGNGRAVGNCLARVVSDPAGLEWARLVALRWRNPTRENAILATFDVKGFGEACRVRVAIPADPFGTRDGASPRKSTARTPAAEISGHGCFDSVESPSGNGGAFAR